MNKINKIHHLYFPCPQAVYYDNFFKMNNQENHHKTIIIFSKKINGIYKTKDLGIFEKLEINNFFSKQFFWPKKLLSKQSDLVSLVNELFQLNSIPNLPSYAPLSSPKTIFQNSNYIFCKSYADDLLIDYLNSSEDESFLYSGGGIIPDTFFKNFTKKVLHIHPGYLPETRGADCLLWTYLNENQIGHSLFEMNSQIDEGDILFRKKRPFKARSKSNSKQNFNLLYNLLFSTLEPALRAEVLIEYLASKDSNSYSPISQDPQVGVTYHFLSNIYKEKIINTIFGVF